MAISRHAWQSVPRIANVRKQKLTASDLLFQEPQQTLVQGPSNVVQKIENKKGAVEYIGTSSVPMQDWDWPDTVHPSIAVTINHLGDVYDSLVRRTVDNPSERWRLYITPGGVRAWNLTNQWEPNVAAEMLQRSLDSDPLYAEYAAKSNNWFSRISGKPKRLNDFVAFPIDEIGSALPNPVNLDIVHRYHDVPIIENRFVSEMLPDGLPRSFLPVLEEQIKTVDPRHQTRLMALLSAALDKYENPQKSWNQPSVQTYYR